MITLEQRLYLSLQATMCHCPQWPESGPLCPRCQGMKDYELGHPKDLVQKEVNRMNDMLRDLTTQINRTMRLKRKPRQLLNFLVRQRGNLEALGARDDDERCVVVR